MIMCLAIEINELVDACGITNPGYYYPPQCCAFNPCHCPPCDCVHKPFSAPQKPFSERIIDAGLYVSNSMEVLFRGFALGFGMKLSNSLLSYSHKGEQISNMYGRFAVSAISGMSTAALIHGASIVIPERFRLEWFLDSNDSLFGGQRLVAPTILQHETKNALRVLLNGKEHKSGYEVQMRYNGKDDQWTEWKFIATTPPSRTILRKKDLQMCVAYQFRVRAINIDKYGNLNPFTPPSKAAVPGGLSLYGAKTCSAGPDRVHVKDGHCPPCYCKPSKLSKQSQWERILNFCVSMTTTCETIMRGFLLGFGVRMLKYVFEDDGVNTGDNLRETKAVFRGRFLISCVHGLAVAAMITGGSLFIPSDVRKKWFSI